MSQTGNIYDMGKIEGNIIFGERGRIASLVLETIIKQGNQLAWQGHFMDEIRLANINMLVRMYHHAEKTDDKEIIHAFLMNLLSGDQYGHA